MASPSEEYRKKLKTAEEAVAAIPDGAFALQGNAVGEAPAILDAIAARVRSGGLSRLRMGSLLPTRHSARTIFAEDVAGAVQWTSLFTSGTDREDVRAGRAEFIPVQFHQVPRVIRDYLDVDVAIVCVSRVDDNGYMSLGVSIDTAKAAIAKARYVIAEVNQHMPRVHGAGWVHVSEVDAIVEHDEPVTEIPLPPAREEDEAMGALIAEMIPNGATIQLGIGGVPNAVAGSLLHHRDLGIHTEMFVDSMVDLIESGVANGSRKVLHPGKAIFSFAAGSRRTYEFLDDNPAVEGHPVDYTNHPTNIARNEGLISVNSTIEIDLTGQCCSESMGYRQFSGTGGQLDFVRGAFDAGGKSIIAFYSTAKGGEVSRVVPTLTPGAAVTTPRTDVHYVVSEFGVARLKGRSTRERAQALISLAHPKFREELTRSASEMGYLSDRG